MPRAFLIGAACCSSCWRSSLCRPATDGTKPIPIYTRYLDYIGQFVMHCHILDHEDLGMMEVEEVVPDFGALAAGHHHH